MCFFFQEKVEEKPEETLPTKPKNLKVVAIQSDSVTLTWETPESTGNCQLKGYIVVMREADKNKFKKVGQTDGNTRLLNVTKVKAGKEYYFRVYSENEVGISEEAAELDSVVKILEQKADEPEVIADDVTPEQAPKSEQVTNNIVAQ